MKEMLKRTLALVMVFALLSADVCAIAEAVATLVLPKALKVIEEEAFYGNTSIEKVIVPDGATEIADRAFANSSLSAINLPDSIEYIADDAFESCAEVEIEAEEGSYAYNWAVDQGYIQLEASTPVSSFTYSVTNGEVVIDQFVGNETNVIIPGEIDGYPVTTVADNAFRDCAQLLSVKFPESVTSIGGYVFWGCSSLMDVKLPLGMKSIGECTFQYCEALEQVQLPTGLTEISNGLFYGSGLKSVEIPAGVTSIAYAAFMNCENLQQFTVAEGNATYSAVNGALYSADLKTLMQYLHAKTPPVAVILQLEVLFFNVCF